MKAVEMMKQAIKDSEYKGYHKWTAKRDGLHWDYMTILFKLTVEEDQVGYVYAKLIDEDTHENAVVFVANEGDEWLCDEYHEFVKTVDEAIYWATRKMIYRASQVY